MGNWEVAQLKELTFTEQYYEFNKLLLFILKTLLRRYHQENGAHRNY